MSAETTQLSEEKVDVTVNDGGKRKHRWYHWFYLALFISTGLLNAFQGLIFSSSQWFQVFLYNVVEFFEGGNEWMVYPEDATIDGPEYTYEGQTETYELHVLPDNAYSTIKTSFEYESTSEGTTLTYVGLNTGWILHAGKEGVFTFTVTCLNFPDIVVSKTVNILTEEDYNERFASESESTDQIVSGEKDVVDTYDHEQASVAEVLKKLFGHFLINAVTGFFGYLTLYYFVYDRKKKVKTAVAALLLVGIGFLISFSGEFVSISGFRNVTWSDVLLNFEGFVFGAIVALLLLVIVGIVKRHKAKNLKSNLTKGL